MHHEKPPPKRHITVHLALAPGETLKGAWAMLPEPLPRAVKLTTRVQAGRASIRLPELTTAAIVLAEVTK